MENQNLHFNGDALDAHQRLWQQSWAFCREGEGAHVSQDTELLLGHITWEVIMSCPP